MAHHTSHRSSEIGDEAFDLSYVFIGREQQLDLFKIYLDRWQQHMFAAAPDDSIVTTAPSPNNKIQGLVVLLYGRGGFGKSTLLRRYCGTVLAEKQKLLPGQSAVTVSSIVDWEFAIEGKRGIFTPGQELDAAAYFQAFCGQLAISLDKNPKEFKEYQSAVRDTEKARKEASGILDSMQKDDRYAWLRELTVEAITTAIRTYVPGSGVVLDNPRVKSAADEAAKLTQEQISRIRDRLRDRLGSKIGDYLDAALRLGLALGHDLHDFAKNFPLLIFFDTYEEVDDGDRLLRIVMGAAGLRVGWVLAGRDNLWAGPGQTERSIAVEYGYKEIVPTDRALAIDFNAGGVGAFTLSDIKDYFDLLCKQAGLYAQLPQVNEEGVKHILDMTGGVPLAVTIAAGLYMDTGKLDTVTETVEGKREIIDKMVRRYLLHARDSQDERAKLYGLAMLRRADQPLAVAAALGLTADQAKTSYGSELSRLHRRYSFIFTEKEEPALHQEVRHFLRLWLLEHRRDPEIMAVNERLKEAHEDALKKLEQQMQYATLQERMQDEEWTGFYLDLTEQQFWLDPVEGVRYMLPFMIAAAIYRRTINEDAAKVGAFFETSVRSPYRTWWTCAAQSLMYTTSFVLSEEALSRLEELAKLASQRCPTFLPLLPDYRSELEAALWWRLGEAYLSKDDTKALAWYEKALTRLGGQIELKEAGAQAAQNVAYTLYQEKKYAEMIPFLDKAIALDSNDAAAYNLRGFAYLILQDYQRAFLNFNHAIELDPNYALAYNSRGTVYASLKEYQRAILDYDHAIAIDPKYVIVYYNRGLAYNGLKEYQRAILDFDRAIALDPNDARAYLDRGNAYYYLKEYQRAVLDYDRTIALDPNYALAYSNRGEAYRNLKEYQRAVLDFDHAIALDPNSAAAYSSLGLIYVNLEDYQRAVLNFDHAIELDPNDAATYSNRGNAYANLEDYQHAILDFGHAIELDPNDAATYSNRGNAYGELKEYQRAILDFDRVLELDSDDATAYLSRGRAYSELEDYQRAILDFDHAIELDPNYVAAYFNRGIAYASLEEYQHAILDFDHAIELDPNDVAAYNLRGIAYASLEEYQRAFLNFNHAIELDANYALAYNSRGTVYYGLKEYQRAILDFDHAIELDPNDAATYSNRGLAYNGLKEYQRAVLDFDHAIALDSNDAAAYNLRGFAYLILKDYQHAILDFDRVLELDSDDATAYLNRGIAYLWLQNVTQAVTDFSRNYELNPADVNAGWAREWAGMSKQREDLETATRLETLAATDPQHYVAYVCRGVASGLRGKVKESLGEVERAILLKPEEWDAYFWKGMFSAYYYRGQARLEEARAMIEQALSVGLPPVLLTPLYWLEKDRPDFFEMYARPLLERYGV